MISQGPARIFSACGHTFFQQAFQQKHQINEQQQLQPKNYHLSKNHRKPEATIISEWFTQKIMVTSTSLLCIITQNLLENSTEWLSLG